ncbi:hypothetical protein H5410_001935 [Solanum commersonii]|uniref:Uncharacterized protein n=1 Tax=Solanum commersonii TaxID=4109 RepID=A0A9J6B0Y7_SOLCO|nr:hypothetical protein H5410_001935 [Solanum commersonii]
MLKQLANRGVRLGNKEISFWRDDWLGNGPLIDQFHYLFILSSFPNATVEELWTPQGWNIVFKDSSLMIGRSQELLISLLAYGGQFGKRGMQNVLKAGAVQSRRSRAHAFLFSIFGVKKSQIMMLNHY